MKKIEEWSRRGCDQVGASEEIFLKVKKNFSVCFFFFFVNLFRAKSTIFIEYNTRPFPKYLIIKGYYLFAYPIIICNIH